MPALVQRARWEASQRPLFVKTVWQNGVRHAILSKDDPLFARSVESRARILQAQPVLQDQVPTLPPRPTELERCLMKLQLVLATEPKNTNLPDRKNSESHGTPQKCKVDFPLKFPELQ